MNRSNFLTFLKSSKLLHVAVVLLVAFAVRMVYLYEIHDNPFFQHLALDENSYDQWARRIAAGQWLGKEIFYQDPLYPYFLAIIYSVIGRDFVWVRVIQLFVGSVTCVLIYLLGSSLFNRATGLVAGLMAAFYRPFFYFEGMFLKSFLGVFLICLFMLVLIAARPRRSFLLWVAAGFVLGVLALVRANTLLLAAGVIVWLFLSGSENENVKYKLIAGAGFLAGLMIVLLTVCARNYVVGKDVVLLTSQGGQNFFIGNNPWNYDGRYAPPIYIRPNPKYEQEDFRDQAEIVTGRRMKPSELSRYWFGEAFRFMEQQPGKWLKLMVKKSWMFWNWYEVPDNQNFYFFAQYASLLRAPLPNFHIVAALALAGMILCLAQWRKAFLLYAVVIIYSGSVIAFYVFDRYKLPVVPPLIVFAAFLLTSLAPMITQKKFLKLAGTTALTIVFFFLLGTDVNRLDYYSDTANAFCRLGSVYGAEGRLDDAISAFKQGSQIMPYHWATYYGLGEAYARKGEVDLAIENYTLARMYSPANPDICANLGSLYYQKGQLDKSAELYEAAAELKPDWIKPHYLLARIYQQLGKLDKAQKHLDKLAELRMSNMPDE